MKHLKVYLIVLMLLIVGFTSPSIYADMGPKPTTDVEIIGLDQPYDFDLLKVYDKEVEVLDDDALDTALSYYYKDTISSSLNGYQDDDGYASYSLYTNIPRRIEQKSEHVYHCGYFAPPDVFKVVVVTTNGCMYISPVIRKQTLDAYITFDVSESVVDANQEENQGTLPILQIHELDQNTIYQAVPAGQAVREIISTVLFTIVIEGLVLFAFGYRKISSFMTMLYVNLATQAVLYVGIILGYLYWTTLGWIIILLIGETLVFALELFIFRKYLIEQTKKKAIIYTIAANLVSLGIGLLSVTYVFSLIF